MALTFTGYNRLFPLLVVLAFLPHSAYAHVKWFAPYIVGVPPQAIGVTLADQWFWLGIGLMLVFFLATRLVETSSVGEKLLGWMDRVTGPLWWRLDDFVRCVIGAFFVAIFAVGGVYLTPDLKTHAEWVSWTQLLIACLVFSKRTQVLAAAGIVGLCVNRRGTLTLYRRAMLTPSHSEFLRLQARSCGA